MAFIGVRISWLMLARKALLALVGGLGLVGAARQLELHVDDLLLALLAVAVVEHHRAVVDVLARGVAHQHPR